MSRHFRYLAYVLRHKWWVFIAGLKVRAPLVRLVIHDASKFRPSEFFPYAAFFYGEPAEKVAARLREKDIAYFRCSGACMDWDRIEAREYMATDRIKATRKAAFDVAWLHHQKRNDHHWQYWVLVPDSDGPPRALEMPRDVAREMLADWMGAGRAITGRWEVAEWYAKNRDKMVLHPATRAFVEILIHSLSTTQLHGGEE